MINYYFTVNNTCTYVAVLTVYFTQGKLKEYIIFI